MGQKVGYFRVSTDEQEVDRQLMNIELDKKFIDKCSGSSTNRPQLQEMLRYVRKDDKLFVDSMDRLARNTADLLGIVKNLNDNGIIVEFIKEKMSFSGNDSPMSILMLAMLGAMAEFERRIVIERQKVGIQRAREMGKYVGRKPRVDQAMIDYIEYSLRQKKKISKIAEELKVSRECVYRLLRVGKDGEPPKIILEDPA